MISYGYFQIFGVEGKDTGRASFAIPQGSVAEGGLFALLPPKNGTTYSFGTDNKHPGIKGIKVSADILTTIVEQITATFQKQDL